MGFFSKLFGGLTGPKFRTTVEATPALASVIGPMKQGNIMPALTLFQHSTADPELRFRLVEAAAEHFPASTQGRDQLLDAWVNNTPNDPYARLVRARWRIDSAPTWYPNNPEEVAEKARAANEAAAQFARAEYEQVARAAPQDPVPWTLMLALPLIFDLNDERRLYQQIMQLYPAMFPAHVSMHHWLSAMWYGDHAQSLGLARQVSATAPEGSDLHALVVHAHFRVYGYEKFYGDGEETEREARAKAILADPQIAGEVTAALGRSLWSPAHRPGHWSLWARHVAAAWFHEAGEKAREKAELEKVGDSFDESASPWNVNAATYAGFRKELGLA